MKIRQGTISIELTSRDILDLLKQLEFVDAAYLMNTLSNLFNQEIPEGQIRDIYEINDSYIIEIKTD